MNILITGGAGYIGSTTANRLIKEGHRVTVLDNLSTGNEKLVHPEAIFVRADLSDLKTLREIFSKSAFDVVIHLASFSQISEAHANPQKYLENNIGNSLNLFRIMLEHDVKKIIFSSTASVFEPQEGKFLDEESPKNLSNPYAFSKWTVERILENYDRAHGLRFVCFRYFNVAGASDDGRFGELHDPETHLIPNALKTALGKNETMRIFGTDFPTEDGTCVRDFIHVEDLANAHVLALKFLEKESRSEIFNLGNGIGTSVREILNKCEEISGRKIETLEEGRRSGDCPFLVAETRKAQKILEWQPRHSLSEMIESAWKWELKNQETK